ncbi:MAG: glycosyltransferase family 4 protein [Ruminococcaceae bacterium]|nr:glycosyltransferase family 4 protein [Oscillospiraceae bacterium]
MKVLKLAPYYAPERISSSHLTEDMEKAYVEAGIVSEIYAPTPTRGVSKEERKAYRKIKYEEKEDGKILVHRFAMFGEGRNPIGRALRYGLVNLVHYRKGIHAKDVDVIVAGSTPPTQGVLCAKVAKKLSKKYGHPVPFVFSLQDMFPESLVSTGLCKETSILYKIGNKISNYTYQNATHIRVISDSMKENLIKKGVPAEKITVIYNWIDTDATLPVAREANPLFDELGLDREGFYVTYAGNLGNSQNVSILLDCAAALKAYEDIRFVIFGGGSEKEKFQKAIDDSGLDNIQLFPLQPMERVSQVYSLGDVSFVTCKKGVGVGAFPSKAVSIMATATPIIASFDLDSDLCRILTENQAGRCADAEDKQGAVDAILSYYNNRALCRQHGDQARRLVCTRFSKEAGTAANLALLKK